MCTFRLSAAVIGAFFLFENISHAQVVTDGTTGAGGALVGPDYDIDADLGTQAGSNLFHSFDQFSIGTGERATFSGPGSIDNVISRVTGGSISSIDGLIASTIPGASLWLFNPAGVVFGPNASLDVTGSFHVSTADELRTADGGRFSAIDPDNGGFSVAEPEAFGFLGANPAGITIAGSQLSVNDGQTLSVVGGDIDLAGGSLAVGGGDLNVLAASGPAVADVTAGDLTGAGDGAVTIRDASSLAATGDGGGAIRIEGGAFVVDGSSRIASTNTGATDGDVAIDIDVKTAQITGGSSVLTDTLADGKGGDINLKADDIQIAGGGRIGSASSAAGEGGDIDIAGDEVEVSDNAVVISNATADGDGGAVNVAADDLTLAGGSIATTAGDTASGDSGDISITASSLNLGGGLPGQNSFIGTGTFGLGNAGDIDITADQLLADGNNQVLGATIQSVSGNPDSQGGQIRLDVGLLSLLRSATIFADPSGGSAGSASIDITADTIRIDGAGDGRTATGISLTVDGNGGASGGIAIRVAGAIDIQNGGLISTSTSNDTSAGDILIVADSLSIGGQGPLFSAQISSDASVGSSGDAGRLTIIADTVDLSGDGRISSSAFGAGGAGVIDIAAGRSLQLRDDSRINSNTFPTSTGAGGSIVISTADLAILDAGTISSSTFGSGNAGSISITADTALLDGKNALTLDPSKFNGITTQASPGSTGNAGNISLDVDQLTLRNNGQINNDSFGAGSAGDILIRSADITIDSQGSNDNIVTGIATAVEPGSAGNGGTITIVADRLVLSGDPAEIVATNDGTGSAGTIDIQLTDSLVLDDGADINTSSASGGGGGITIKAGNYITATGPDGRITTTVADDTGNAGDILIQTPLLALGDTDILARADAGQGGDIQISADDLILSPDTQINAQAGATGIDGTVAVSTADVDLTSGLTAFDSRFLNVSSLLRERCAAKREAVSSSFTLGSGGSLPADLDAPRLSIRPAESGQSSASGQGQRTVLVIPCPKASS